MGVLQTRRPISPCVAPEATNSISQIALRHHLSQSQTKQRGLQDTCAAYPHRVMHLERYVFLLKIAHEWPSLTF